jgi:glucokinase
MHSNLNSMRPCAVGLDVGGTKIAGGVVDFPAGRVRVKRIIPTQPQRGGEAVLADALNLADTLLTEAKEMELTVSGIGIGVCELVDLNGNITSGHTIAWRGLPIQDAFAQLAPTVVESDVRAAALAEAMFGAGQPFKQFVYVTVGTGISSCLVQAGRPYPGARGNALILASSPLTMHCPNCGATVQPVLEEFAAGPALVRRYNRSNEESSLQSGLPANEAAKYGEEVLAAVEANDPMAIEVVKTAGEALGVSVGWLVNVLDPEAVVVGGGLGLAGGLYWASFVASTQAHIWAEASREAPILPASLGPEAGVIGAATAVAFRVGLVSSEGGGIIFA